MTPIDDDAGRNASLGEPGALDEGQDLRALLGGRAADESPRNAAGPAEPSVRLEVFGGRGIAPDPSHPIKPGEKTIVCDGHGGIRPHVEKLPNPQDEECLASCIVEHEKVHAEDFLRRDKQVCAGMPDDTPLLISDAELKKATELKAYQKEKECLLKKLDGEGPRGECRPFLEARLQRVNDTSFKIQQTPPEELLRNGRY